MSTVRFSIRVEDGIPFELAEKLVNQTVTDHHARGTELPGLIGVYPVDDGPHREITVAVNMAKAEGIVCWGDLVHKLLPSPFVSDGQHRTSSRPPW